MVLEKDLGFKKADWSTSLDHMRRWVRLLQTNSVMLLRKLQKAWVAIGGWDDWAVAVFEIGRIGGDVVEGMVVDFVFVCWI